MYSKKQQEYIDSVGGNAHQSALDIIADLEKQLLLAGMRGSQNQMAASRKPLDCVATNGCKVDIGI